MKSKCWKCGARIFPTDTECMACGASLSGRELDGDGAEQAGSEDADPIAEAARSAPQGTASRDVAPTGWEARLQTGFSTKPDADATGLDYWLPADAAGNWPVFFFATFCLPLGFMVALAYWGLGWYGLATCSTKPGVSAAQAMVSTAIAWLTAWIVYELILVAIVVLRLSALGIL